MSHARFSKVGSLFRTTLKQGIDSNAPDLTFNDTPFGNIEYPNWFVLEPNSSNYEIVYMPTAPIGATFSGVVRGINPGDDVDTSDAAYKKGHAANVEIVLAPVHRQWNQLVDVMDGNSGTGATALRVGKDADDDIYLYAQNADANKPFVKYDKTNNKWLLSNDGTSTYDPSAGGSGLVRGLGIDIQASSILLDVRTSGGLRNNQGVGSQQADVDPAIVARLDTTNTWTAPQTHTTSVFVPAPTDPGEATPKAYVDGINLGSGTVGENVSTGDAIGVKILSTGANLGSSTTGTSVNWSNPNNVFGAGNATNTTNPTGVLRVMGFGFSVPSTATITGVEVTINMSGTTGSSDFAIRLVKAATPSGTSKTYGGIATSLTDKIYGNRFDLWGNTLTYSDVNASNFGVDINITNIGTITVDYVKINVYYTDDKLYKSSAGDNSGFLLAGFAKAAATSGNTAQYYKANSVITGSSLIPGKPVYLADTAGTVSQTPGTKEILLGTALTTTSWLFQGVKKFASGSASIMATEKPYVTVSLGFKPRIFNVYARGSTSGVGTPIISHATRSNTIIIGTADQNAVMQNALAYQWTNGATSTAAGTFSATDDGFLFVPVTAAVAATIYYEAYE